MRLLRLAVSWVVLGRDWYVVGQLILQVDPLLTGDSLEGVVVVVLLVCMAHRVARHYRMLQMVVGVKLGVVVLEGLALLACLIFLMRRLLLGIRLVHVIR